MSREEQEKDGFTTPKKFAVITPSREKIEEKAKTTLVSNSFYSLSKESFHTIPDHLSPDKMDKKVKNEEPRPDAPKSSASVAKKEPSLHDKLAELISSINLKDKKNPHEIIRGLNQQGITTWEDFVLLEEDDIPGMHMNVNGTQTPLPSNAIRKISRLKELIWKNIDDKMPTHDQPL